MNENINLVEILKDAPKGTLLYSPIFGELAYIGCFAEEGQTYSIIVCQYPDAIGQGDSVSVDFDENGIYLNHGYSSRRESECLLFPSKDNIDWSIFKAPWKHSHFEPFQKVLFVIYYNPNAGIWTAGIYSHYAENWHYLVGNLRREDEEIIPYEGNEDKLGKPVE